MPTGIKSTKRRDAVSSSRATAHKTAVRQLVSCSIQLGCCNFFFLSLAGRSVACNADGIREFVIYSATFTAFVLSSYGPVNLHYTRIVRLLLGAFVLFLHVLAGNLKFSLWKSLLSKFVWFSEGFNILELDGKL